MPQLSPIFWSIFPIVMFMVVMISFSFLMCFMWVKCMSDKCEVGISYQAWCW
uniref:ATP synthase F0 subunit 8 n=1 Tax=Atypus karschi TaxID=2337319 RepID=A0A8A5YCV6_9ARAC|nr:ATP synthase F0 subunit 8 [Atypus karschi]QTH31097.1 ATP synthase F0 subunit 8 [Atypus karschi]